MRRLAGRLALLPATVLMVTLLTFVLVHLAPGDAAAVRAGTGVTAQSMAENRALAGLDRPLGERYAVWLWRSLRFDFGASLSDGRPVRARIAEALPATLGLALLAVFFAAALAIPLGTIAALGEARRMARGGRRSTWIETLLALLYGLPIPALALLALRAGAPWGRGLVVPALCLSLPSSVVLLRHQRSALLSVLGADFMRTARAKGASASRLVWAHGLRSASVPTVMLLGTQATAMLSGSVLVERIFGLHGLGLLGYEAVLGRDEPLLMALTTLAAVVAVLLVLAADGALALLDPRLGRGA